MGPADRNNDQIMEDIIERESLQDNEEVDDAASSLSKELMLAKQMNQNKDGQPQPPKQAFMTPGTNKSKKLETSIGKQSNMESDVDGLLQWAKELPDDISVGAGQSFYGMLNRTLTKNK